MAVKLSPYFTAFGNVAREVIRAGADGLVLFNRFYQTDIDIETIAPVHQISLSSRSELLVRLRWVAILRSRTAASLAVSGGVATPADGIKAILAGADAVQLVSAILRHGPSFFAEMREGLARWLDSKRIPSVSAVRGRLSLPADADAGAIERGNFLRLLQTGRCNLRTGRNPGLVLVARNFMMPPPVAVLENENVVFGGDELWLLAIEIRCTLSHVALLGLRSITFATWFMAPTTA